MQTFFLQQAFSNDPDIPEESENMKDDSRKWGIFFAIVGIESGIGIFLQVCLVKIVYFIIYTPLYHPRRPQLFTFFYFRLESIILDRSLRKQKGLIFNVALQSIVSKCYFIYNILLQKHLK